jgi:2-(1,2-epoxy-1,2-dihydrophenyl)acetyl-CoA isomerase
MVSVVAEVETSRAGAVLTIRLNRPDVLNALNAPAHAGLATALEEARDASVRAVVLTGAGRGFCTGQDLGELRADVYDLAHRLIEGLNRNVLALRALEKPVLAAVNGAAAGAGLSLALACDARIAADDATFVPGFVRVGLAPDSGATWLVRRAVGAPRAFEWLATGRPLSASEARDWGLVSEVVLPHELAERAAEVAELFASMPTRAVWETKRLLDAAETSTLPEQLELEATTQAELTQSHDFYEGVAAFLEKREPAFTGEAVDHRHPVHLVVRDDLRRWRLTVFLRWLLVFPHSLVVAGWGLAVVPVALVAWIVTLVRGQLPEGLHGFLSRFVRYWTHVSAYQYLVADPFPSFRGWEGTYGVDLQIAPPAVQARWKTLLRPVFAIVLYIPVYVFGIVVQVLALIGWFVALALGRMPKGLRDIEAFCLRIQAQCFAFSLFLTDRWPTFDAGVGRRPGPPPPAAPAPSTPASS